MHHLDVDVDEVAATVVLGISKLIAVAGKSAATETTFPSQTTALSERRSAFNRRRADALKRMREEFEALMSEVCE